MIRFALCTLLLSVIMTTNTLAEQKQTVGDFDIHYIAIGSTFITPTIAKSYGIKRSKYIGLINISVLNTSVDGHPAVPVQISGVASNPLNTHINLVFKEIKEGKAVYYIAEFPYRDQQDINFNIAIKHEKILNTQLKFKQKFYVD